MLPEEIIAIEGDAEELSVGDPQAKIGNHGILNCGITEIASRIGGHQSDSWAWL